MTSSTAPTASTTTTLPPFLLVPVEHRRRLLVVDAEPRADRLGLVVLPAHERPPPHLSHDDAELRGPCTASGTSRRRCASLSRRTISSLSMSNASTASTPRPSVVEHRAQPFGLRHRAHDAVEDHAVARTAAASSSSRDDAEDDGIGHEVAAVHERLAPRARASCPRARAPRSTSPVASVGTSSAFASSGACVPFPAPGFPKRTMIMSRRRVLGCSALDEVNA